MTGAVTVRQRVRHYETDAQGVVFNMWYLGYCDEACADFLSGIGLDYGQLVAEGYDFQVVRAEIDWSSSLGPHEIVDLAITCDAIGTTSFTLRYTLTCEDRAVADVRIVYVGISTDGSGTRPVPPLLRERLEAHRTPEVAA